MYIYFILKQYSKRILEYNKNNSFTLNNECIQVVGGVNPSGGTSVRVSDRGGRQLRASPAIGLRAACWTIIPFMYFIIRWM